jgi:hypothetical protein
MRRPSSLRFIVTGEKRKATTTSSVSLGPIYRKNPPEPWLSQVAKAILPATNRRTAAAVRTRPETVTPRYCFKIDAVNGQAATPDSSANQPPAAHGIHCCSPRHTGRPNTDSNCWAASAKASVEGISVPPTLRRPSVQELAGFAAPSVTDIAAGHGSLGAAA